MINVHGQLPLLGLMKLWMPDSNLSNNNFWFLEKNMGSFYTWRKKIIKCISRTNRCFYGLILEPYMKTSSKRQWCENYFGRPEQKQRMNWRISSKLITRHLREGWVEYFMAPHQMQTFENVSITATKNFKLLNKFYSRWLKACRK